MKIFITGGAGFIGRNLSRSLLSKGHQVTIFNKFTKDSEKEIKKLVELGANLVTGNINDVKNLEIAIKGHECVIHLASKISVQESNQNQKETIRVNVDGTKNLLNACLKHKINNLISISSSLVYKNLTNSNQFLTEKSPTNPTSPYAKSKLQMENMISDFSKTNKFNSIILRLFNVYGHGKSNKYGDVISIFSQKIIDNNSLIIYGDGFQTRDFVAVEDVVMAIEKALNKIEGKRGRIYNIASGKPIRVNDLANLMILISGKQLEVKHLVKRDEIKYNNASIKLAKEELDFVPKIELETGIKNLLKKQLYKNK